jgi:parvulin-like peptidyl-prolyl isomerase
MTQRVKPATPRSHRSANDRSDRRTLYLNIAFVLAIVIGGALLFGAAFASYAGTHWAEVANVNGVSINKDQASAQANVALFRLTEEVSLLHDDLSAGRISQSDFDTQSTALNQAEQNVSSGIVDTLVDNELQRQLAAKMGIKVTDDQVQAQITADATNAEARHLQQIVIAPTGGTDATDAAKAQAKHTAESALTELKGGTDFAQVAKQFSTDGTASTGGDVGWIRVATAQQDPNLVAAAFKLPEAGLTDIVLGTDGSYQIGKVTGIAPAVTDPNFTQRMKDAGVSLDAYKTSTAAILTQKALQAQVISDATTKPSVQREVSEIKIDTTSYTGPGEQVRARHILYTPGGTDPSSTASPIPSNDPAWDVAKSQAEVTYDKLKALVGTPQLATEFASIAQTDSKDSGSAVDGGLLPYYDAGSGLDSAFASAIFASNVKAGDLLPPVRSQFGWHVIMIDSVRPAPKDRAADLQKQASAANADFAALAKANSDGQEASQGGDLGWIARNQIDAATEKAIFAAPVGSVSPVVSLSDGLYIFKVSQEQSRLPDAGQIATLKGTAFTNWYAAKKAAATITGPDVTPASTAP